MEADSLPNRKLEIMGSHNTKFNLGTEKASELSVLHYSQIKLLAEDLETAIAPTNYLMQV